MHACTSFKRPLNLVQSGVWIDDVRLGEVGGQTLGFFGAVFGGGRDCVLAHGYQGALHMWRSESEHVWHPQVVVGGHFAVSLLP